LNVLVCLFLIQPYGCHNTINGLFVYSIRRLTEYMFVYFVYRRLYCGERYSFPLGLIPSCAVCFFSVVAVISGFLEFSPGVLLTVFYRFSDGCLPVFCWSSVCSSEREATRGPCLPSRQPVHSVGRRRTHPEPSSLGR